MNFVDLSRFAQRRFDDIAVIVVVLKSFRSNQIHVRISLINSFMSVYHRLWYACTYVSENCVCTCTCTDPHVELEHVGGDADGHDVVDDELAEAGQEVAPLVQLLDLLVLVGVVCPTSQSHDVTVTVHITA